jgi:hypothetical protein
VVFFLATLAVAAMGATFTPGPWYAALAKPAWTPPGWIFGPVWTVLYVMIAVSAWLVLNLEERPRDYEVWGMARPGRILRTCGGQSESEKDAKQQQREGKSSVSVHGTAPWLLALECAPNTRLPVADSQ